MKRKSEQQQQPAGEYLGEMKIRVYRDTDGNVNCSYSNDFSKRLTEMQGAMNSLEKSRLLIIRRNICSMVADWFLEIYNPDKPEVTER